MYALRVPLSGKKPVALLRRRFRAYTCSMRQMLRLQDADRLTMVFKTQNRREDKHFVLLRYANVRYHTRVVYTKGIYDSLPF